MRCKRYLPLFLYGMFFMAAFNFMSHGTQDPYATFLTKQHGFAPATVGYINTIASIGAIVGGIFFGWLSQRSAAAICIVICAALGVLVDSALGFQQHDRHARARRVRDAIHGAGRMGNHSRAFERDRTAASPRNFSRTSSISWAT